MNPDMTINGMLLNISVSSKKKEKEKGYNKHIILSRLSQSESRITHCANVFSWIKTKLGIHTLDLTNTIIAKFSFNCPSSFSGQDISTFSQSATSTVHSGHVFCRIQMKFSEEPHKHHSCKFGSNCFSRFTGDDQHLKC
jgi:hypothetical protein